MNPYLRNVLLSMSAGLLGMTAICQPPKNGPAPGTVAHPGQTGLSVPASGMTVVQGDILLDRVKPAMADIRPRPEMLTVASQSSLWPPPQGGGVPTVYYVNANAGATDPIDEAANANIQTAVDTFNADFSGVIQWVPWTSADGTYYVTIDLNAGDFSGECEAIEGFQNEAAQPMGGSAACMVGTILHEMGHVIGLWHEFERPDAANYVNVNYNNVIKGSWGNFETLTQNAQILGLYDYASLMQYPPYSFSRNGGPVIETIPAGMPLGNAEGVPEPVVDGVPQENTADYSAGDKEAIKRLYGAPPTQVTVTSNPVGLQVVVDGTTITTPQTYSWTLNSTHTLDVPSGVQTLSGGIENSTTIATFYYTYGRWNDNTAQSHTIKVLPGDGGVGFPSTSPQVATYSANFIQLVPYTTTIYPSGSGTVAVSPSPQSYSGASGEFFVARQQATLTATPASGQNFYQFNNGPFWLEGGLGANPKTFNVPDTGDPVNTTVYFSSDPVYTVDITPETYSSNLAVYVDGQFYYTPANFTLQYIPPGQTTSTWTSGSSHTLSIDTPQKPYSINSRYAFSSWSDAGAASHTISSLPATSTSYIATVIPQFAPATNFSYPPCGGSGTLSTVSPTGDGFYPTGTQLSFSATPISTPQAWTFAGWTFDLTGTTSPANLTATDETLVFANFNTVAAPLTLTSLSPASANAGGAGFTLTLYGAGFGGTGTGISGTSVVGLTSGGTTTYPTVTYVNQGELTVPVTAAEIATPGAIQVYVENYPTGWDGCAVFGYQTFLVHGSSLATSTAVSSSNNPSGLGSNVTFTAIVTSAETNATGTVTFKDGSTVLGSEALSAAGVATYSTSSLAQGTHNITAAYGGDSNNTASTSGTLTEIVAQPAATLTSPTAGGTLPGPSVTFNWTTEAGATQYYLSVGSTGVGSTNVYNSGWRTVTSWAVTGLPTNGETLYVRLSTDYSGTVVHNDYTYTAYTPPPAATITSPPAGSILTGISVPFTWTSETGATQYYLSVGSTGVGSTNLYNSGWRTVTTWTANPLPTNGETLYVRLSTDYSGTVVHNDYTYTAAAQAVLTTPTPGLTLTGPSVTFTWSAATGAATQYYLSVGSTGVGSTNVYNSGWRTVTTWAADPLPTNGETLYVRLSTDYSGTPVHIDYTYTASTQAAVTSPTAGSTLTGPSVTFDWSAATGATQYYLSVGSTGVGSTNVYNSGWRDALSWTATGLPTNGETLYVMVSTDYNGLVAKSNTTYLAATAAVLTTPTPGTTLSGSSVTFDWQAGTTGATQYYLSIGSTGVGSSNIYNSGWRDVTSWEATGLPTNGETLYVRLSTNFGGTAVHNDYIYTAQ